MLVYNNASRTSSPSNNSRPTQRTSQRTSLRHRRRHQPSCCPGSSLLGAAALAGIASADHCIRTVLEEVRTGPEAVRRGPAGLVGKDSGWHRTGRARHPGCSMRAAWRQGLGRHPGGFVVGMRAARLGPEALLVLDCRCDPDRRWGRWRRALRQEVLMDGKETYIWLGHVGDSCRLGRVWCTSGELLGRQKHCYTELLGGKPGQSLCLAVDGTLLGGWLLL
jgi:hypothetical protein